MKKDKFILVVPLASYNFKKAKLVTEAAIKIIEAGDALAVCVSGQHESWQIISEASEKAGIPWQVSSQYFSTDKQFLEEDTIRYMKNFTDCTAKIALVSMEYCSERLRIILEDAHCQNIDDFVCSFIVKSFIVKSPFGLDKFVNPVIEAFRTAWYRWSRNEI